jgi:hypothetical protein
MTDGTMIAIKAHSELHIERHDEHSGVNLLLGEGEGYSHAKINAKGQLTLLNEAR